MDCINWNIVGTFAALAFCGLITAMLMRKPLKAACASFMAMPHFLKVALVSIAIVATVQAQKQNGGNGTQGLPTPPRLVPPVLSQTVSDEEIARGYRFAYETNDIAHNYTMPANATYVGNAHIHGAASSFGRNLVDFGGWSFHFGPSNTRYSSAWWFIDGRIRFAPHDAGREISTGVSGSVLAMQGRSRIWHGPCDGGYAICWENVFLGGDTNAATNLQIVMRDNGWFETWSNEVGRVYKSINPYDWDDDGLDNTIDSAPKTYDGDCFGTGVEWLNANCGAILSASLDDPEACAVALSTLKALKDLKLKPNGTIHALFYSNAVDTAGVSGLDAVFQDIRDSEEQITFELELTTRDSLARHTFVIEDKEFFADQLIEVVPPYMAKLGTFQFRKGRYPNREWPIKAPVYRYSTDPTDLRKEAAAITLFSLLLN